MSLRPHPGPAVPEQTARVAHAAFPRDNVYLRMRDAFGAIFADHEFAALFPTRGQPAAAPGPLALVTIMQYVEDFSDRRAADAVRSRIDWQYALRLALTEPGFDSTVLSEFRTRFVAGAAEQRVLDALLEPCRTRKWLKARGRQRTDSMHVLARGRAVNRLECVMDASALPGGMGDTLWTPGGRLPSPDKARGASGVCPSHGDGRAQRPGGALCPASPAMVSRHPCGRDVPTGLGPAIVSGRRTGALAHGEGRQSPRRTLYQFPL
jgi:transposase